MFESPRERFIRSLWLSPWIISFSLPLVLYTYEVLSSVLCALAVALTSVCWQRRKKRPEAVLVLNFLGILLLLAGASLFVQSGEVLDMAFVVVAVPLTAALATLRPRLGLGAALGFFLLMYLQANVEGTVNSLYLFLTTSVLALLISSTLKEYEDAHLALSKAALTDPTTGLGNFYALKRDFERYQARSQRAEEPLLLIRWCFSEVSRLRPTLPPQGSFAFVRLLNVSVRQGDSLYYLGEHEYISLHPKLATGDTLTSRVQQVYPEVQVSWSRGDTKPLVQALAEARKPPAGVSVSSEVSVLN